jgi:hypothetical protein
MLFFTPRTAGDGFPIIAGWFVGGVAAQPQSRPLDYLKEYRYIPKYAGWKTQNSDLGWS